MDINRHITKQDGILVGRVPSTKVSSILGAGRVYPLDILPPRYPTPPFRKDMVPGTRKGPGTRDTLPHPTPVDSMTNDTRLWKHYFPATSLAIGN